MKRSKKLLVLLASVGFVSGIVACGGTSTSSISSSVTQSTPTTSVVSTPSSTPSSSESSPTVENTFGEGITDAEKTILAKITTGHFEKATFTETGSLKARFNVTVDDTLKVIVYKGLAEAGHFASFDVYVGVDVTTFKIVGIQYDGQITSHGHDSEFADNDLGLVGTEGESSESVSGATLSSNAIKTVAKEAVAQAKKDAEEDDKPSTPDQEKVRISYNLNGGSGYFPDVVVDSGELPPRPAKDPTKTDYDFMGWYYQDSNGEPTDRKFDFSTPITEDVRLIAVWRSSYTFYEGVIYSAPKPTDGKLVIPSTIDGQTVTTIGEEMMMGNEDLVEVVIPASVTKIGFSAFENCKNLTKISYMSTTDTEGTIVKDLSIGLRAFAGCTSLTEVTIPGRMSSMGYSVFEGCTSLKKATFETITSGSYSLPETTFKNCTSLQEVVLGTPNKIVGDAKMTLFAIKSRAFENCTSLSKINSENINSLDDYAFTHCTSLNSFTFGQYFNSFKVNPFEGCVNLSTITVNENNTSFVAENNALYNAKMTKLYFAGKTGADYYEFPATVTSYEWTAFDAFTNLKEFRVAEGNTIFSVQNGVLFKKPYASSSNVNLDKVPYGYEGDITLSENCKSISNTAIPFINCPGLKDIHVAEGNTMFVEENGVIYNSYKTSVIYVNKSVTGTLVLPDTVKDIYNWSCAFANIDGLVITTPVKTSYVSVKEDTFTGVKDGFKIYVPDGSYGTYSSTQSSKGWEGKVLEYLQETPYVAE